MHIKIVEYLHKFNQCVVFFLQVVDENKTDTEIQDSEMGGGYEIFYCECCDQGFTNLADLQEHGNTHIDIQDGESKYMDDSS